MIRKRASVFLTLSAAALVSFAAEETTPAPDEKPVDLKDALDQAAGAAFVEVTSLPRKDMRPADGPLLLEVKLKAIKKSGLFREKVLILLAPGGLLPPGDSGLQPGLKPLKADSLAEGSRYWMVFSSGMDWDRYPQGVIAFWPAETPEVTKVMAQAIETDRFRWQPQYSPEFGLTLCHLVEPELDRWRIRMEKEGKVLWETMVEGAPIYRNWAPKLFRFDHPGFLGEGADLADDHVVLTFATRRQMPADKECGIDAGEYRVIYVLDAQAGRLIVEIVTKSQLPLVELCRRAYDLELGTLKALYITKWFAVGGKAVGAEKESWVGREVRRFDPETGKLIDSKLFRPGRVTDEDGGTHSGWIPLKE